MFATRALFYEVNIIILLIVSYRFVKCDSDNNKQERKFSEAVQLAQSTTLAFVDLFDECMETTMNNQQFAADNLQKFILWPPRTTVGLMPKFTSNRKFFANLLATTAFKEMLSKDEDELRVHIVHKMKYCDEAIMDTNLLKDFYDREVDQTKL